MVAQPGQGFGNSRHRWCTYLNFRTMYDQIYSGLVQSKLATCLNVPVFMDKEDNIVDEDKKYGRKVTHKFTHPELVLVFDETGGNTSQEKDGRRGNQKFVCGRGFTPQRSITTQSNHFTVLGVTLLDETPVMCVIIFAGKKIKGCD